jgi:hypothetical protein
MYKHRHKKQQTFSFIIDSERSLTRLTTKHSWRHEMQLTKHLTEHRAQHRRRCRRCAVDGGGDADRRVVVVAARLVRVESRRRRRRRRRIDVVRERRARHSTRFARTLGRFGRSMSIDDDADVRRSTRRRQMQRVLPQRCFRVFENQILHE